MRRVPTVALALVLGVIVICWATRPAAAQARAKFAVLAGGAELEELALLVQV